MVLADVKSGSRLTREALQIYSGCFDKTVPLATIEKVAILHWSDGAPSARVYLDDGGHVFVNSVCFSGAERFTRALEAAGVRVEQD